MVKKSDYTPPVPMPGPRVDERALALHRIAEAIELFARVYQYCNDPAPDEEAEDRPGPQMPEGFRGMR